MQGKIILLDEIYEIKNRKDTELKFYRKELELLIGKMNRVQSEINLTNKIIKIIEEESVIDIRNHIKVKSPNNK
jgi:hypothetical protein